MTPVTFTANQKLILATFVLSNPGIGEVVRRTRGVLQVNSDQGSLLEMQQGALGAIVVNDRAIAAGAASIPGPLTDQDDDGWLLWVPVNHISGGPIGAAVTNIIAPSIDFDSKAMRKVEEGFSIAFMYETFTPGGAVVSLAVSLLSSRM